MRRVTVILDFIKLIIAEKIVRARTVIAQMTDNPNFPLPDIILTDLTVATDLLEARLLASANGGKENTVLLHQAEATVDDMMRRQAKYVDRIANGSEVIIIGSGFTPSKQPAPAQRPEFSVEPGQKSGSVLLRRQAIKGAKAYIWQYCVNIMPDGDEGWTIAQVSSKASVELSDLTPVTKYWFRVAAVMSQETTAYNSPVMHVVS